MRIIISALLLLGGLNLVLARSVFWNYQDSMANKWLSDYYYEDELFNNHDDINKLLTGKSSEELKETPIPTETEIYDDILTKDEDDELVKYFSALLNTFHVDDSTNNKISKEDTENNDEFSKNQHGADDTINNNEDAKNDDSNEKGNADEEINQFEVFLHVPSDSMETDLKVSKSSEEKKDDDDVSTDLVEIIDLTKSSEENKKVVEGVDLSEKDIEELAALIITLSAIDDLMKIDENEAPDYADNEHDDELKSNEVNKYLNLFSSILDKMIEDAENYNDDVTTPKNESDEDQDIDYTTPKNESNEDEDDDTDDVYTTPKTDSNKDDEDDTDESTTPKTDSNEDDDTNTSNENKIVFYSIDDDHRESNLEDSKYNIAEILPERNVRDYPAWPDNQNVIQEYVEIRKDLDIEQNALEKSKLKLDQGFYNVISSDYNQDSMNKFGKDFFVINENLDRIKRNINAMQNLSSKLYFHKLIRDAVKDV